MIRRSRQAPSLSKEQRAAVRRLLAFGNDIQTLGGYAGTGKTTVIKHLAHQLPDFAVVAYTGKAANVLRRKGVFATTIHSLIYDVWEEEDEDTGKTVLCWDLKSPRDIDCQGVIVDEASMVSRDIYDDLRSLDLPLIFVGDHGQLEPVQGKDFNLMQSPDIVLETIHRNAGEIARFAEFVRKGGRPQDWLMQPGRTNKQVRLKTYDGMETNPQAMLKHDQIIVAYNDTRVEFNRIVRDMLGLGEDSLPLKGDRIICLRNDRKLGVFNGMQGIVKSVSHWNDTMRFESDGRTYEVKYMREVFNSQKPDLAMRFNRIPIDFSYVITCHKAQGDEWDNVLVFEQPGRWDMRRWFYTAASRARKRLTWVY